MFVSSAIFELSSPKRALRTKDGRKELKHGPWFHVVANFIQSTVGRLESLNQDRMTHNFNLYYNSDFIHKIMSHSMWINDLDRLHDCREYFLKTQCLWIVIRGEPITLLNPNSIWYIWAIQGQILIMYPNKNSVKVRFYFITYQG